MDVIQFLLSASICRQHFKCYVIINLLALIWRAWKLERWCKILAFYPTKKLHQEKGYRTKILKRWSNFLSGILCIAFRVFKSSMKNNKQTMTNMIYRHTNIQRSNYSVEMVSFLHEQPNFPTKIFLPYLFHIIPRY